MAGESILVIDDSLAVLDMVQTVLHDQGYHVTTVSNGTAALTCPSLEDVSLVVIDEQLDGLSSREAMRILKQNGPTHPIPILLMVPEESLTQTESVSMGGACAYMVKPFEPQGLVRKVEQVLDQQRLDELSNQYLSDAADRMMSKLADQQIAGAVERKTQLIIERCIQNITTTIDQRARAQVDEHVTSLVADKEQELVKLTVREVAQSMVEKLAAAKVEEAMNAILAEHTDRAVRGAGDKILPNMIREKVKEMLNNMLPREVDARLQKAAEKMVPEISQQIVATVEDVAKRAVPRAGRELLPQVVEGQVATAVEQSVPRKVSELVSRELDKQLRDKLEPTIKASVARIRRNVMAINTAIGALIVVGMAVMFWLTFGGK